MPGMDRHRLTAEDHSEGPPVGQVASHDIQHFGQPQVPGVRQAQPARLELGSSQFSEMFVSPDVVEWGIGQEQVYRIVIETIPEESQITDEDSLVSTGCSSFEQTPSPTGYGTH